MATITEKLDSTRSFHEISSTESTTYQSEDQDINQFGYKAELQRRFGLWSMIGLSCTIMVTWEGWLVTSNVSMVNGGKAGSIYGFLFCWIGYSTVVASLAELISMTPTAGGQYHWTFELTSAKYRRFISWFTGWQLVLAWQAGLASVVYLIGTMIQALAILNYPDYIFERWHGTLIIWLVIAVTLGINTLMGKLLPWIEGSVLAIHILGFFVVLIPLVCLGTPHASAHEVFTDLESYGGFSKGLSWFVGLVGVEFAFLGADGAIHMAEEVINSRVAVPKALMASIAVNGVLGFAIVIAVMFTIGDLSAALQEAETGFIFIDYFARALRSDGFATGLVTILIIMFFASGLGLVMGASRVTWAFARDQGLPMSSWLKKVSPNSHLPTNAIVFSGVISFLLSFINIGSAVAFNAIVSLVVGSFFCSYVIPIVIVLWRRVGDTPVIFGPWALGRLGVPLNICAIIWLTLTWVFSFFPVAIPVTPQTMNWSSVLWVGTTLFGVLWYFAYQRHKFTGPTIVVRQ